MTRAIGQSSRTLLNREFPNEVLVLASSHAQIAGHKFLQHVSYSGIHDLSAPSASSRLKLLRTGWKAIDTTNVQPSVKRKRKADYWNERDDDRNDKERNSIEQ